MKRNGIDGFVSRWSKDGSFRSEFRVNPTAALQKHGIDLDAQELQAVTALGSSESLGARISLEHGGSGGNAYC